MKGMSQPKHKHWPIRAENRVQLVHEQEDRDTERRLAESLAALDFEMGESPDPKELISTDKELVFRP